MDKMLVLIEQMLEIGSEYVGAIHCPPELIFNELMFLVGILFISTTVINFVINFIKQRRR